MSEQTRPLSEDDRLGVDPAYPINFIPGHAWDRVGLTKRELFAAMAMQGILSGHTWDMAPYERATIAVEHADALLKELAK